MKCKVFSALAIVLFACVCFSAPIAQAQSSLQPFLQPNVSYPAQAFTATSQTGTGLVLAGKAFGTIEATGASFTTFTWGAQGSNDGGINWFPLNTATLILPGTKATTETTTSNTIYAVNLAGLTNIRFVTSGTFTAVGSVFIKLTAGSVSGVL